MRSNESSGVRTCTALSVSSQQLGLGKRRLRLVQGGIASCQLGRMRRSALSEDERYAGIRQSISSTSCRAPRVETRTSASRELIAEERGRRANGAVAPDELASITRVRSWWRRRSPERDAVAEFRVVGVARITTPVASSISVTTKRRSPARGGPAPLDVSEHTDAPCDGRVARQCQHRQHQILTGDEDPQFLLNAGHRMLIACDPGAVPNDPAAGICSPRQRSGVAPHTAPESSSRGRRLPRRIAQRIVGERGQPVLAAVPSPGER